MSQPMPSASADAEGTAMFYIKCLLRAIHTHHINMDVVAVDLPVPQPRAPVHEWTPETEVVITDQIMFALGCDTKERWQRKYNFKVGLERCKIPYESWGE